MQMSVCLSIGICLLSFCHNSVDFHHARTAVLQNGLEIKGFTKKAYFKKGFAKKAYCIKGFTKKAYK